MERLPCGASFVYQIRGESELVHGAVRVHLEPEDEPAHQVGLARLWADALVASGSAEWPRAAIDGWIADHGAALDVVLDGEGLEIAFRCRADDLAGALAIARDLLVAPSFDERALESAKNRVVARLGRTAPSQVADRALEELLFGDRASGSRLPHKSDLAQLGIGDVQAFHAEHVRAERVSIALDGPLPDGLAELVEAGCAGLPQVIQAPAEASPTVPGAGAVLVDVPDADHSEVRMALAPAPDAPRPEPVAAAALWLHARYHTPKSTSAGRPVTAVYVPAAVDLQYRADGVLAGAVSVSNDLAPAAAAALQRALLPPADASLDPARLEEARAGVLAVLDPAEDAPRLAALLARAREGVDEEWHSGVVDAVHTLDGPAVLEHVRAHAARSRAATVYAGPAAELAPRLARVSGLAHHNDVRQPRGTTAGLELRAVVLAALGGGERWAELATLALAGEAELAEVEGPLPVAITRDLRAGHLILHQELDGLKSTTVSTREASWIRQASSVTPLDPERHAALRFSEERQFFRLVAELARGRELVLTAEGQRLDLWRGAERWAWLELGPDGRPTSVGCDGGSGPVELSEWTERDGFLYPARMRQPAKGTSHRWSAFEPDAALDPELLVRPGS